MTPHPRAQGAAIPTLRRGALAAGLLALAVAAVCIRLGVWQLDRLAERRARNAVQEQALRLAAVPLADSLRDVLADPGRYAYRRVTLQGSWIAGAEVVLRGRARDGRPGVQLLTPFRLGGGATVLVNRGWAPAADAATVDVAPLAERGARRLEAVLQPPAEVEGETRPIRPDLPGAPALSVARVRLVEVRDSLGMALLPLLLHQLPTPGDPALPARLPLPEFADRGPHLGYAIQWFSFAAIALGGTLLLLLRGRRR